MQALFVSLVEESHFAARYPNFVIRPSLWVKVGETLLSIAPLLNSLSYSFCHYLQPIGHHNQALYSSLSVQADREGADAAKGTPRVNYFLLSIAFNATKRDAFTPNITPCRDHLGSFWSRTKNVGIASRQQYVAAANVHSLRTIKSSSFYSHRTKIGVDIKQFR